MTHSPFIISAAGELIDKEKVRFQTILSISEQNRNEDDRKFFEKHKVAVDKYKPCQKVYLINEGDTVDLFGVKSKGRSGYSGGDCINVVNEMLGSNISDYFGSLCFLAEKSVCAFLSGLKENRNLNLKPFSFILSKGNDQDRARQIIDFRNEAFLYAGMTDRIKVIFDFELSQKPFFNQFKGLYPTQLIELSRDEIEPLYGEQIINDFLQTKTELNTFSFVDNKVGVHIFGEFIKTNNIKTMFPEIKVELGEYAGKSMSKEAFEINFPKLNQILSL